MTPDLIAGFIMGIGSVAAVFVVVVLWSLLDRRLQRGWSYDLKIVGPLSLGALARTGGNTVLLTADIVYGKHIFAAGVSMSERYPFRLLPHLLRGDLAGNHRSAFGVVWCGLSAAYYQPSEKTK